MGGDQSEEGGRSLRDNQLGNKVREKNKELKKVVGLCCHVCGSILNTVHFVQIMHLLPYLATVSRMS